MSDIEISTDSNEVAEVRTIVCDTETTGLDPEMGHKIIEIGAIEYIDNKPTGNKLHVYLDPQREIPYEATKVHGMTRQDCVELGNGQIFKDVADDVLDFFNGAILVAHNAPFDVGFFNHELSSIGKPIITDVCKVVDTLGYANGIAPTKKNSLDQLAKRYGVTGFDRSFHGALLDSMILAEVFIAMRESQKHLSMSDVLKSTDSKRRVFDLKDIIKPISQEISSRLPLVSIDAADNENHKKYLSGLSEDLSW
jgi:DNA polymerase-3 subunit epsilon